MTDRYHVLTRYAVCILPALGAALPAAGTKQHAAGTNKRGSNDAPGATFRAIEQYVSAAQAQASARGAPTDGSKLMWHGKVDKGAVDDKPGSWHSQSGQDTRVAQLLEGKRGGFFVDLAANEPVYLSNTRALERDYGWRGICIDANQELLHKLATQRTCRVFEAAVSTSSGKEVEFTAPAVGGSWEDAMGGIVSTKTDNKERRPNYAKRQWHVTKTVTVALQDILDHANAPAVIDYLSLDIEGAEYDALKEFDFAKYRFNVMTIERPIAALRTLLRANGYVFILDNGCYGDQTWVHSSMLDKAKALLRAVKPSLYPGHVPLDRPSHADFNLCCDANTTRTPGATIDNGCCGYVGAQWQCVEKLKAAGRL